MKSSVYILLAALCVLLLAAFYLTVSRNGGDDAVGNASAPIDGDASSAWVELMGAWAPDGACGDPEREWIIDAEAFHRHEAHCRISRLELLQNGVRAIAHCSIEGDDDRAEEAFKFLRRPDASLSVIIEANDAVIDGLKMCGESEY
jgi:hypothetical protein